MTLRNIFLIIVFNWIKFSKYLSWITFQIFIMINEDILTYKNLTIFIWNVKYLWIFPLKIKNKIIIKNKAKKKARVELELKY